MRVQLSNSIERTKLTCTPRERCCPEHLRQMRMPYDTDAQFVS